MNRTIARLLTAVLLTAGPCAARITKVVVERRESPAFGGKLFGKLGAYQRLVGKAFGELDPADPLNAIITDLALAPRNARGMVEYAATFTLTAPLDPAKSNGVLLYDVVNRGGRGMANAFQAGDPGDGFLYNRGFVMLSSGWQGDVRPGPNAESLQVPTAHNPDGSSITGPVLARFANMKAGTNTVALTEAIGPLLYQRPATLESAKASLRRRESEGGALTATAPAEWAFADCRTTPFPGTPDPEHVCLKGGFDPAALYELVFTAKDPLVLGIGFAATRDVVSFFRYAEHDEAGTANPLGKSISSAISWGPSQSGNFIRTFIHLGFNQDENGRMVWDGANDHIAARQLAMNIRFAVPGGAAALYEPGSDAVVWWEDYTDERRHRERAGMLDRCRETGTCPKIFETFGGIEFWYLRASPGLVGTDAAHDIPLAPNVRRYYFPGTSHGGGNANNAFVLSPKPPTACSLPANANPESLSMRALLLALTDWVTKGMPPPPSRYPTLARGELVKPVQAAMGFPSIPGAPSPDGLLSPVYDYDFGPNFRTNDLSGIISNQPPAIRQVIPMLVPKVDADGNEVGGVPSVLHQAPLGSYLGWNVTASGYFRGQICGLSGGFIPFAKTKVERMAAGDPRPSLEERYGTHDAYVAAIRAAADRAVRDRFLLKEDADRFVERAAASEVLAK